MFVCNVEVAGVLASWVQTRLIRFDCFYAATHCHPRAISETSLTRTSLPFSSAALFSGRRCTRRRRTFCLRIGRCCLSGICIVAEVDRGEAHIKARPLKHESCFGDLFYRLDPQGRGCNFSLLKNDFLQRRLSSASAPHKTDTATTASRTAGVASAA